MSGERGEHEMSGDAVLAAEYVLGLLDEAARAAFERRLRAEPGLQGEVHFWQSRFSGLDVQFDEVAAPSGVLNAVEARLFGDGAAARAGLWNNLMFWRALATGALMVGVVGIGLNVLRPAPVSPELLATQLVAALEAEGSTVKFLALYDGATGAVRLAALSGDAVPDKDFELWFIKGSDAPISMGVIPANQRSEVEVPQNLRQAFGEGTVLAITLEPKGGSPSGKPTGPVIASGPALKV